MRRQLFSSGQKRLNRCGTNGIVRTERCCRLPPSPIDPRGDVQLCKDCFYQALEEEVHQTIVKYKLFKPGEVVALGASGGKDSTVLAHIMNILNERYEYASS